MTFIGSARHPFYPQTSLNGAAPERFRQKEWFRARFLKENPQKKLPLYYSFIPLPF